MSVALNRNTSPQDKPAFYGLLALLVFAPLPLGSNRIFAIGVLVLWASALLALSTWAWHGHVEVALSRLRKFQLPIMLLAAMVCLTWLQTVPLPADWVMLLSPAMAAYVPASNELPLSLEVYQTQTVGSLAFVYFAAFVVTVLTVRNEKRLGQLAQTLIWSGVLQAVIGAIAFSVGARYSLFYTEVIHSRMLGTFVYHNHAAGYFCITLSIGIGFMLARLSGSKRTVSGMANWKQRLLNALHFMLSPKMRLRMLLVIMVIALVLTRSRMGNSAFFASMLIVGLYTVIVSRRTAPATIGLIISLVIIDILIVGTWVGLEKVVSRVQETSISVSDKGSEETVEERTQAGRDSLKIVEEFPLVGTGGGSFYATFMNYRSPGTLYFDHAHNDFAEIASEYGFAGLSILGILVATSLWKALNVLRTRRSRLPRGIAFGTAMSMVALMMHSTVDFNLQLPANALTITVVLAMAWLAHHVPSSTRQRRPAQPV